MRNSKEFINLNQNAGQGQKKLLISLIPRSLSKIKNRMTWRRGDNKSCEYNPNCKNFHTFLS